ncbi:MAG TPA: hypothetical protein VHX37_04080 [Acidobacteriaceae bacterium]|jgi:hypothetical protein|nr:hypothetical protein [Acidobacteriaceae bacterium]
MNSAAGATPLEQKPGILGEQFGVAMSGKQSGPPFSLFGALSQDDRTIRPPIPQAGAAARSTMGAEL